MRLVGTKDAHGSGDLMDQLSRRGVIALAGVAAGVGASVLTSPHRADAGRTTHVTRAQWVRFARKVKGPVYLPGTSQYARGKLLFDTRYDGRRPAAVLRVAAVSDVQRAMAFAADHRLRVTPRGGGHSYIGASAASGTLVLDMRHYTGVSYDARTRTADVMAGDDLYAVHAALAAHGRTMPTGTCPTVGAAGLTLGGGIGVESRAHGLTCDRLTAATVVLPDGTLRHVSEQARPDVFWALRGGGGGQVGFVTRLTFATHAASARGIFGLTFPAAAAADVVAGWSRWLGSAPRRRWAGVHVDALGDGHITVSILGVTTAGDERSAGRSLIREIGTGATRTSYRRLAYLAAVRYLGGGSTSARTGFLAGSDIITRSLHETRAPQAIVEAVRDRSAAGGTAAALLDPLDGAVSAPRVAETAFPWRHHTASLQWYAGVGQGGSYARTGAWIDSAHRRVRAHSAGGYVNYLEADTPAVRYFGPNLGRLSAVQRTYDPDRVLYSGLPL